MGGKSSKSTQTITIPPEVLARYNAVNARAETAASTPFRQYGGEFVAPINATQRQGINQTVAASTAAQPYYQAATGYLSGAQEQAQPYYQAATGMTEQGLNVGQQYLPGATAYGLAGGEAVNPTQLDSAAIQQYMSPYLQNVLQGTAGLLNQQNQRSMSGQLGNAISSGAFGGDRGGIAAANLHQQQQLADAQIYSNLLNQGYTQALNTAAGQQALGLSAAQANRQALQATADRLANYGQQGYNQYTGSGRQMADLGQGLYNMGYQTSQGMAGLGAGAQSAALQGAQAATAAGTLEQQTQQAEDTARYNQFLQEQSYPFQTAQFLANIAEGTGALSGSTTTTAQPGGFFSDRHLKENIEKIGKTYDGQNIYRYNYKGDDTPQIGLIAQEVEKRHPEAVGLSGGMRTVNYDKATDAAADRGHFYNGGLASPQSSAMMSQYFSGMSPSARQGVAMTMQDLLNPADEQMKARAGLAAGGAESMGGGVLPEHARQGFAMGGMPDVGYDPSLYAQLLQGYGGPMYQSLFGGLGGASGGTGVSGIGIPSSAIQPGQLMIAGDLPRQESTLDQLGSMAALGANIRAMTKPSEKKPDEQPKPTPKKPDDAKKVDPKDLNGDGIPDDQVEINKFVGLATGGPAMPYGDQDQGGLNIPNEQNQRSLMTPGDAPEKKKSGASKVLKLGIKLLPMFLGSDRRLKENIRDIGKTFDGQTIYSYNFKGDPRTQIGLIAQEVEGHHPDAVRNMNGVKMVNYKSATEAAAKRGKFAIGGMPDSEPRNPILDDIMKRINPVSSWDDELEPEVFHNDVGAPEEAPKGGLIASPAPAEKSLGMMRKPIIDKPAGGLAAKITEAPRPARPMPAAGLAGKPSKGLDDEIVSFFKDKGLSHDQARGIAAGIAAESSNNHAALNPITGAMGLGQWLGPRKRKLIEQFGRNPSKEDQLEFLWQELNGGDRGGPSVLAQKDSHSVLHSYINNFMRPAKGMETEGDISRGIAAMRSSRFSGGVAGRHGYAVDGGVLGDDASKGLNPDGSVDVTAFEAPRGSEMSEAERNEAYGTLPTTEAPGSRKFEKAFNLPQAPQKNGFFNRLGRGETDAVLSALTGLAAMGTAPTRNFGVALAAGLGSGAQAYQAQREFGRQQQETGIRQQVASANTVGSIANLQRAVAEGRTSWSNIRNEAWKRIQMAGGPGKDPQADAEFKLATQHIAESGVGGLGGGGIQTPSASVGKDSPLFGAPAPSPSIDYSNPQSVLEAAQRFGGAGISNPAIEIAANLIGQGRVVTKSGLAPAPGAIATATDVQDATAANERFQATKNAAAAAQGSLTTIGELQGYADTTPNKYQGIMSDAFRRWGGAINQIARAAIGRDVFSPEALGNVEAMQKSSGNLANIAASAFGNNAGAEVLGQTLNTVPNAFLSPEGFNTVLSATRQAIAQTAKQSDFNDQYKRDHPNDWWRSIDSEYRKKYTPDYWVNVTAIDRGLSGKNELINAIKRDPSLNFKIGDGRTYRSVIIKRYGQRGVEMINDAVRYMSGGH